MARRTISITEEAYQKLKRLKRSDKDSFSEVILKYYPSRRKLSEILAEIGADHDLANLIEATSKEMLQAKFRETKL